MKKFFIFLTALYGLFWLVFGLNNFFHFFPIPEPSIKGAEFMKALETTGYSMPIVYATQVLTGILLLVRRFVALALLLLAPIVSNIILYDFFLNPSGLVIGLTITIIYGALLLDNRDKYTSLFTN